jgi:hypothetical protein
MFVLNIALSNCGLARVSVGDEFDKNMKKCNTISSVRKMAEQLDSIALAVTIRTSSIVDAIVQGDAYCAIAVSHVATASLEVVIDIILPIHDDEHTTPHFDMSQKLCDNMMANNEVSEVHLPVDDEGERFETFASYIGNDVTIYYTNIQILLRMRIAHHLFNKTIPVG